MKILITGGKSAAAFKYSKRLNDHQVIFADYGEVPAIISTNYTFISLGIKNEETLVHTYLKHCLNEGVDAILPTQQFEITALQSAKTLFEEFAIEILSPNS